MLHAVIHLAIGLLAVSFTCFALSVFSYTMPGIEHASLWFAAGSYVATGISLSLTAYVVTERL
jgi:hypothetical protein